MRVMVLVKATDDSEKGPLPSAWATEMMAAMGRFNDELRPGRCAAPTRCRGPAWWRSGRCTSRRIWLDPHRRAPLEQSVAAVHS